MAEVVRRRYARTLLEARDLHPEAAEFSQENPAEVLHRLSVSPGMGDPSISLRSAPDDSKNAVPRLPDLIIVDGGKGQLNAAGRELQRLGLHDLPIIGLAKEFEEIHRPGRALPLLLPRDSGALKLLQRIRDEAHRFANSYHQLLMKRRIGESILDDCPGVSAARKQALLQRFGSVARLRKLTAAQIASVDGVGPKLAEQVVSFLIERVR
jgi:excinuclease ABC subunit C